jgi:signal transduction histidine kinase
MAASVRGPVLAGRASRPSARVRSAAQRPVLRGTSTVGDLALAAVVTVAAVVAAAKGLLTVQDTGRVIVLPGMTYLPGPSHAQPHSLTGLSWALAGVVAATAPLAWRRTYPTSAFAVILAAFILTSGHATVIAIAAVIVAAYSAVAYSKYRWATLLGLPAGALIITVAYPAATAQVPERYTPLLVLLPTLALGSMMRMWRQRARDAAERLCLTQAAREAETRDALQTERARIAGELHDVVTHNVSVMVVQAGAARQALDVSPGDARAALQAIEASGRAAMTELRHLLGLLTPAEPAGPGAAAAAAVIADDHALRPQPSLAEVPALVARVRAAGLPVDLTVAAPPRELARGLDLAVYRVIQEALTNVIKHADRAPTAVRVEYRAGNLLADVANQAPAAPGDGPDGGHGRGLIGLRERIAVYGGSLDAGPRPGGGWRVRATIPLDAADAGHDAPTLSGIRGAPA